MFRGMDTKKSCGIWFGWNILCLKQRIWFASSLSIQLHKILVCWIQFDWRVVHKWLRLSLCQVHAWNCNGRFDSQELYCGHVGVVEFRQWRDGIVCGDMLWEMVTKWVTFSSINAAVRICRWRTFSKPSAAMARKVAAFEKSAGGFKLAPEQLSACRWFGEAMDVALQEEENKTPLRNRAQHACLLIGAGGTGKTTIILELMLDVFCRFFPARPGEEERYMIATFSHAQSDAISNDVYRARTCHTACSYRVASLRNKHLALETKEQEMKQRWQAKILVIQDEISLVPAAVENMMLYRSMRARQDEGLDPSQLFPPRRAHGTHQFCWLQVIFLQIKPANEISLADNLEELIRKMPHRVQTEHHAAQAALMTIDTVIHLKKSKRFLDAHLPEITTAMRTCTPAAPLSEDHLAQLRTRKIENCKKELTTDLFKHGHVIGMYWENIARSMVERANRDAQDLDVPLFCLQAADTSAAHCSKPASHWQIARHATGAREHGCATGGCLGSTPWIG